MIRLLRNSFWKSARLQIYKFSSEKNFLHQSDLFHFLPQFQIHTVLMGYICTRFSWQFDLISNGTYLNVVEEGYA